MKLKLSCILSNEEAGIINELQIEHLKLIMIRSAEIVFVDGGKHCDTEIVTEDGKPFILNANKRCSYGGGYSVSTCALNEGHEGNHVRRQCSDCKGLRIEGIGKNARCKDCGVFYIET
jgi:hypothetical protein